MIQDGQTEEVLAIAMSSAHGVFFGNLDQPGKDYLRRCANAALLRLGADAMAEGEREFRRVLADVGAALNAIAMDPEFIRLHENLREAIIQASYRVRFIAGATGGEPVAEPALEVELEDDDGV